MNHWGQSPLLPYYRYKNWSSERERDLIETVSWLPGQGSFHFCSRSGCTSSISLPPPQKPVSTLEPIRGLQTLLLSGVHHWLKSHDLEDFCLSLPFPNYLLCPLPISLWQSVWITFYLLATSSTIPQQATKLATLAPSKGPYACTGHW